MADNPTRWYGVSTGDGNNGVSHLWPNYMVKTADPWKLAELAAAHEFKEGAGKQWADRNVEIDGDADFCISAVFYNPPCEDTADGEYPDVENPEDAEDGRNWSEYNGAWFIVDVYPIDDDTRENSSAPEYESIEACFGESAAV